MNFLKSLKFAIRSTFQNRLTAGFEVVVSTLITVGLLLALQGPEKATSLAVEVLLAVVAFSGTVLVFFVWHLLRAPYSLLTQSAADNAKLTDEVKRLTPKPVLELDFCPPDGGWGNEFARRLAWSGSVDRFDYPVEISKITNFVQVKNISDITLKRVSLKIDRYFMTSKQNFAVDDWVLLAEDNEVEIDLRPGERRFFQLTVQAAICRSGMQGSTTPIPEWVSDLPENWERHVVTSHGLEPLHAVHGMIISSYCDNGPRSDLHVVVTTFGSAAPRGSRLRKLVVD